MPKPSRSLASQLHIERQLDPEKHRYVVGVDEVGRGSWAGPLCVGAVAYDLQHLLDFMKDVEFHCGSDEPSPPKMSQYLRIDDSKRLSPLLRESLISPIMELACTYGIGMVDATEIDQVGMTRSLTIGLERALEPLGEHLDDSLLLLDGGVNFSKLRRVLTVVKGDSKSFAIASASIVAKVTRDRHMKLESESYPWYCFEKNKGYPSPTHVSALHAWGPCVIHRTSWSYMDSLPWSIETAGATAQEQCLGL